MSRVRRVHEADSLTGAILAVEGVRDAAVLLNGPTGCKFYHGALVEGQLPRERSYDHLCFQDEFYFGQPRVPSTYLDGDDYVFGASEKLERILPVVASRGHSLIAVINTPGAALIGDDLARFVCSANLDVPCMSLESTGYSGTLEEGFQEALTEMMWTLAPLPMSEKDTSVNLLGLSIGQKNWEGNCRELERLLSLCGISIGAVIGAGTSVEDLMKLRSASLNVMIHEELGDRVASWCEERYGIATLRPCKGAPIGFDNTENWVRGICEYVGVSPEPAVADIDRARMRAVRYIRHLNSLTGLPKGATFVIRGTLSVASPLARWLYGYLGMVPVAIDPTDSQSSLTCEMREFLENIGCARAWKSDSLQADCVFADGATLALLESLPGRPRGIEIALPSRGYVDVVEKSILGASGSLQLLEWIYNALADC